MSNRDIFFWKYFKWDSRNFFFSLNKIIFYNKVSLFIKYLKKDILRFFLRILMLLAFFRKKLLEISILEYILNRIFVFCYLSIFYLYFIEHIKIINIWLLILLILIECGIIYFIEYIIKFVQLVKPEYIDIIFKVGDSLMIALFMDPLTYRFYTPAKIFFEVNGTIWNFILGNSISLNILKKYMIWVNENTQGYYYKNMDILVKKNIVKLHKLNSIPFDILPKTRYIILNLYYNSYSVGEKEKYEYNLLEMKNVFLSFFEKTYDINSSLLSILFLLRINYASNSTIMNKFLYENIINEPVEKIINFILFDQKLFLWRFKLAEIHISNPKLLNIFFILNSFSEKQFYDIENYFMYNFLKEDIKDKMPVIKLDGSIKNYKENIKILYNFLFYQEEGIIWNKDINKYLYKINKELELNRKDYALKFLSVLRQLKQKGGAGVSTTLNTKETFVEELETFFEFDKNIDYKVLFNADLDFYKNLNLRIINIKVNKNVTLNEQIEMLFEDLEFLDSNDLESSRFYSFIE